MKTFESPGAVGALGASVADQLGGGSSEKLIPKANFGKLRSAQQGSAGDHAMMAAANGGAQGRRASVADPQARPSAAEQHCTDLLAAQEFQQITKFVAACRRQWPGAMIALRPNEGGPPQGADAPPNSKSAPERT